MEQDRFVKTDNISFYGEYLNDQIVAQDHFLRKLRWVIEWSRFTRKLMKLYKGEGVVGRPQFIRHRLPPAKAFVKY
jgi:beta-glucosidase/6-phospho-beta-glucosidase/beta-galactosidase